MTLSNPESEVLGTGVKETLEPKKIKCQRKIVSPKKKGAIVRYCNDACNHMAEFTQNKMCLCCGSMNGIKRNPTYASWIKRFDEIIEENMALVDGFCQWPAKRENRLYAWVKMGLFTYLIDSKLLAEYKDLNVVDAQRDSQIEEDRYEHFFEYVKRICPRIAI